MGQSAMEFDHLVQDRFADVCIEKSLARQAGLGDRALPAYVIDWLISRYSDGQHIDRERIKQFIARHLPDKAHKNILLNDLVNGATLKILDAYSVSVDVKSGLKKLRIPCLDIFDGRIEEHLLVAHPLLLVGNIWGSGTLSRRPDPDDPRKGEVWMEDFKPMQTSIIDLDYFVEQRRSFSLDQWRELLMRSMGYNPQSYTTLQQQWLISRLLPLVQPRVNLIELAPKGTGKSFVFSQLSRHAWLISGGVVTRAQLFYDMQQKSAGVITRYDAIILDEVQTIHFSNPGEIVGALKGYLESGEFRVMQFKGDSEAGLVLLANIPIGSDLRPRDSNYFSVMPDFLQETAFLDRFHGLIPGWQIPRITKESLGEGMGLKADYFSEVLHALRGRPEYLDYVKTHLYSEGDLRDIRAVERLASGYLKLLFPDLSCATSKHFEEYCLLPARQLRLEIRHQLATLDPEYKPELARVEVV